MGSSDDGPVLLEAREEGVLTLTLNRPERRSAIDAALREAFADAAGDHVVRGVILTGAGGAFCAGGDLAGFEGQVSRRLTEMIDAVEGLDAHAARRAGLLSELADDALAGAHARAKRMLARAPLSFAAAKRLLALAADTDQRSAIVAEGLAQTALRASEDHREGLAAARERREPVFRGS